MIWMIEVNGFVLDVRHLRPEIQEKAFQSELIPYIPRKKPTVEKATNKEEGLHL